MRCILTTVRFGSILMFKLRVFWIVLLGMSLHHSLQAKSLTYLLQGKKDSTYIENYFNDVIVRLYSDEKTHSIQLNDLIHSNNLKYLPNGYSNLGIGLNFRSFGLSLAAKLPVFQSHKQKYGETNRLGIQSYLYTGKFSVDLFASFMQGYYLKNSSIHLPLYSRETEYQRPDVSSATVGSTVNYIFNHTKFSYKAAFTDTERQKRSAGSVIAGGSIFIYQTKADSAIVPRGIDPGLFIKSRDISRAGVLTFNANLGYAYSLVFLQNGIVTLSYILGTGTQYNAFDSAFERETDRWRLSVNHAGRLGIGYRYRRYYARVGIIRSSQYTSLKYNDLGISNGLNYVQVSLGKRFSIK